MLKKLKSSLLLVCLLSLITGCVNQNQQVQNTKEISVVSFVSFWLEEFDVDLFSFSF